MNRIGNFIYIKELFLRTLMISFIICFTECLHVAHVLTHTAKMAFLTGLEHSDYTNTLE